jgi:thioredoxin-like negative regulator of GroEL
MVEVPATPLVAARYRAQWSPLVGAGRGGALVDRIAGALPRAALEARLQPLLD